LPYPSPHALVKVSTAGTAPVTGPAAVTYSEFAVFSRATAFRASAAFSTATRVIAGQGVEPAHAVVARVTGDLFGTLGVQPETGRAINLDQAASGAPVVIVSHAVGVAFALAAGRSMTALLHGIEPTDPPTLLAVPVVLAIVGLAAASLAAARVFRADPAATLRGE
jgi:hypothetical protein